VEDEQFENLMAAAAGNPLTIGDNLLRRQQIIILK
jgi:hypothetical protein